DRNRSHWSTSKTPSYTKSVSWQHHRRLQKAIIKYYEIIEAGAEREIYTITLDSVVISSLDFTHVYYPGSSAPNMHEVVGLRFRGIQWNYVKSNIIYDDAWMKPAQKEKQNGEYK
ncbi:type VI secretion system tube protein Hcp, partial [Enterobacter roggenkampii]